MTEETIRSEEMRLITALKLLDRAENLLERVRDIRHVRRWVEHELIKTRKKIQEIHSSTKNLYAHEI